MKYKKNQGFTLVELMVSVAVLSIVTLGIAGLLRLAAEQYSNATKETEVQNLLQSSFASVSNSLVDALYVEVDGEEITIASSNKIIKYKYNSTAQKLYYDEIAYSKPTEEKPDEKLSDEEKIKEAKESGSAGEDDVANLLADRVSSFSVDPHLSDGYVVLAMTVTYQERTKSLEQNVFLRNLRPKTKVARKTNHTTFVGDEEEEEEEEEEGSNNTLSGTKIGITWWNKGQNGGFSVSNNSAINAYVYCSSNPGTVSISQGGSVIGTFGQDYDNMIKIKINANAGCVGISFSGLSADATVNLIIPSS